MTHEDYALNAAHRFLAQQAGAHLASEQLLDHCAQHISAVFCLTHASAMQIAMQALSEIESEHAGGFIDIDRCSSRMVIVRDSTHRSVHMVSAGELLTLVRGRPKHPERSPSTG